MRGGSANNIYVIPAPQKLKFGTAMLLAAACCVPAILSLLSMAIKILDSWEGKPRKEETTEAEKSIAGAEKANAESLQGVNKDVRFFLSFVEIPIFAGAVLSILIIGELNFFSYQVRYQTEPFASIGK
jgi:hypothetical protein